MYSSGDAAEQVVRMSLEGAEFALKISGSAAKNLAAALYTVLKDQKKTKGKARIETMLREKRPMTVYTIKKEDAPEFARQAKGHHQRCEGVGQKRRGRRADEAGIYPHQRQSRAWGVCRGKLPWRICF